jgi:hypothetical protein
VSAVEKCPLDVLRWVACGVDLTDTTEMQEVLEIARRTIEYQSQSADGRPIAMRIRFDGASSTAGEISAYPERFEQQIKSIGAEIAGDDLWIERVEIAAVGKLDLESAYSEDSAFGKLLRDILSTPRNPDEISGLRDVVADLRQKIPSEAFGADSVLNLDESQTIKRLVDEAKHMLVGRLLTGREVK